MEIECHVCASANAKKCSACGSVAYCNVEHQKKDWAQHKNTCKSWKVTKSVDPNRGR